MKRSFNRNPTTIEHAIQTASREQCAIAVVGEVVYGERVVSELCRSSNLTMKIVHGLQCEMEARSAIVSCMTGHHCILIVLDYPILLEEIKQWLFKSSKSRRDKIATIVVLNNPVDVPVWVHSRVFSDRRPKRPEGQVDYARRLLLRQGGVSYEDVSTYSYSVSLVQYNEIGTPLTKTMPLSKLVRSLQNFSDIDVLHHETNAVSELMRQIGRRPAIKKKMAYAPFIPTAASRSSTELDAAFLSS